MKIIERRLVIQEWCEAEFTKNGWDSHGWQFRDSRDYIEEGDGWVVISHLDNDKFGNPILGIVKKR